MREQSSGVVHKTPEQLQEQVGFVNASRTEVRFHPPREAIEQPEQFMEQIAEHRRIRREDPTHFETSIRPTSHLEDYERYVKALRSLRKSQREHLQGTSEKIHTPSVESFIEHVNFHPAVARSVVCELLGLSPETNDDSSYLRQNVEIAMQSKEDFQRVVKDIITDQPSYIFYIIKDVGYILPRETIVDTLRKTKENIHFLDIIDSLSQYLPPDEIKEAATRLLTTYENNVSSFFVSPLHRAIFTPEEVKSLLVDAMSTTYSQVKEEEIAYFQKEKILSVKDLTDILTDRIKNMTDIRNLDTLLYLAGDEQAQKHIIDTFVETYRSKAMGNELENLRSFSHVLPPEQRDEIVEAILTRDPLGSISEPQTSILTPPPLMDLLPKERVMITAEKIIREHAEDIDYKHVERLFKLCSTHEERMKMAEIFIDVHRPEEVLKYISALAKHPLGASKEFVQKVIDATDATHVAECLVGFYRLVEPEYLREVLRRIQGNKEAEIQSLVYIGTWGHAIADFDPEFITGFVKEIAAYSPIEVIDRYKQLRRLLPDEYIESFTRDLYPHNPIYAWIRAMDSSVFLGGVFESPADIIEDAKNNHDFLSLAPKSLRAFYKTFSPDTSPAKQMTLVNEGITLYKSLSSIRGGGLDTIYKQVLSDEALSSTRELELIHIFDAFSKLTESGHLSKEEIEENVNSFASAREFLFHNLTKLLDVSDLTEEEMQNFMTTMKTPTPFTLYRLQRESDERFHPLLGEVFRAIAKGEFTRWKYGDMSDTSFSTLKNAQLLPSNLTLDQYVKWAQDGGESSNESIKSDAESTAQAIRTYLNDNITHLRVSLLLDELSSTPDRNITKSYRDEAKRVGTELARINSAFSDAMRTGASIPDDLAALKESLVQRKKQLERLGSILRFMDIDAESIVSGYFRNGSRRRGEEIAEELEKLMDSADPGDRFVFENIRLMLENVNANTSNLQSIVAVDTSDPKVWLEIGEKPVASCQSYNYGSHNECLPGYLDPNTKILVLMNKKGQPIARSILRLLTDQNGNPALHLERIYSSLASDVVKKLMTKRAYAKSQALGVKLFVSNTAQNEDGNLEQLEMLDDFIYTPSDTSLQSYASRAPYQYVDSAGGKQINGQFSLTNLAEVRTAG
jgi:hypothetical protein